MQKLNKCIYGLSGASLKWYYHVESLAEFIEELTSKVHKSNNMIGYILVHVNNFLFVCMEQFHKTIISKMSETFINKKDFINKCDQIDRFGHIY